MPHNKAQHLLLDSEPLPTIPAVALKVIHLARDNNVSIDKLARTMLADPALAAKTMRFANSAYYCSGARVATLQQAVIRLGLRGTKLLALSFSLVGLCDKEDENFDYDDFWQRSLCQAVIARRLAAMHVPHLIEESMLAGLLADVGAPLLARRHADHYRNVHLRYRLMGEDHAAAEQELLQADHAAFGANLLKQWGLPEMIVIAVQQHHKTAAAHNDKDNDASRLTILTGAASQLTSLMLYGPTPQRTRRLAKTLMTHFSFAPDRLRKLMDEVGPEVAQFAQLLEINVPPHDQLERSARTEMLAVAMSPQASATMQTAQA